MYSGLSPTEIARTLQQHNQSIDASSISELAERFVKLVNKAHLVYRVDRSDLVVVNKHGREARFSARLLQQIENRVLYVLLIAFSIDVVGVQLGCGQVLQLAPDVAWAGGAVSDLDDAS
jgi:hypothetical protein